MNQVQAWIASHKPQAAAGGLVAVAGVVTYVRKRKAAATGTSSSSTVAPTTGAVYDANGNPIGGTTGSAFDSSANDVTNSLQPILEQLQATANQLSTTPPISQQVPVTTPTATLPIGGAPAGVLAIGPAGGAPIVTAGAAPSGIAPIGPAKPTYSQIANPAALRALPAGTNLYAQINGVQTYLTPAAFKALKPGTAVYTRA